jgi:hypothetical protein
MPAYAAIGNHTPNSTFLTNWPEKAVAAASGGTWAMQTYPSINGSTSQSYPSGWYAFDVGSARFYLLDAAWSDTNVGSGSEYSADYAAHWTASAPEYQWLSTDLAAHPDGLKFAFFHYPLYSDQSTAQSDTYLHGSSSLEGLLAQNHVSIAFNGHAHVYERNYKMGVNSLVSYITGGGGATLQSMGGFGCSPFNAYGLGWKASTNVGSACGSATVPSSIAEVYNFLLVSVNGTQVTVRGINSNGAVFDLHTYDFSANGTRPPTAPSNVVAGYAPPTGVTVNWNPGTDDIGVNSYQVSRNGSVLATLPASRTNYVDTNPPAGMQLTYTVTSIDGNGLSSAAAAAPPLAATTSITVAASADAYVRADQPTTNFGTATTLYAVGASAPRKSYLRFPLNVPNNCRITSASLELHVTDGSSHSGTLGTTDGSWTETGITANSAPAIATTPSVMIGATTAGQSVAVDVTPLVTSGAAELDLGLTSTSSDRFAVASREASGEQPELDVECVPG